MKSKRKLTCSILVRGRVREGEIDGKKAKIVEAIEPISPQPIDWEWEFLEVEEENKMRRDLSLRQCRRATAK